MKEESHLEEITKQWHGNLKSYLVGFTLCLLLTFASFMLVTKQLMTGSSLTWALMILAGIQALIQVLFFLHVGQENHPKWETLSFCFMVMCVLILVVGSLWVIYDLDERTMKNMPEMHKGMQMPHPPSSAHAPQSHAP